MIAMRRSDPNIPDDNLMRSLEQAGSSAASGNELSVLLAARARERTLAGLSSPLHSGISGSSDFQLLLAQQQQQQQQQQHGNQSSAQWQDLQALLLRRRLEIEGLQDQDALLLQQQRQRNIQRQREDDLIASHLANQRQIDEILASRAGPGAPSRAALQEQLLARSVAAQGSQPSLSVLRALQNQESDLRRSNLGLSNINALAASGRTAEQPSSTREESERSGGSGSQARAGGSTSVDEDNESESGDHDPNSDTFPFKLFRMLVEAEKEKNDDIISFLPHGHAFAIHKPREFVSEIMPKYFTTSRMSSFQRQLNLYGFRRITEGREKGGYYHESFVKGRRSLCKNIKRKKTTVKAPPNFFGGQLAAGTGGIAGLSGAGSHVGSDSLANSLSVRQLLANSQGLGASGITSGIGREGLVGGAGALGSAGFMGRSTGSAGGLPPALAAALAMEQRQQQQQQQTEMLQLLLRQQEQDRQAKLGSSDDSIGRRNE